MGEERVSDAEERVFSDEEETVLFNCKDVFSKLVDMMVVEPLSKIDVVVNVNKSVVTVD